MVYLASPLKQSQVNTYIANLLEQESIPYFLPQTINLVDNLENIKYIGEYCYQKIDECTILVAIAPFGLSTAAEIGYIISRKRKKENVYLILLNLDKIELKLEAAIDPYIDYRIYDVNSLKLLLKKLISFF